MDKTCFQSDMSSADEIQAVNSGNKNDGEAILNLVI